MKRFEGDDTQDGYIRTCQMTDRKLELFTSHETSFSCLLKIYIIYLFKGSIDINISFFFFSITSYVVRTYVLYRYNDLIRAVLKVWFCIFAN